MNQIIVQKYIQEIYVEKRSDSGVACICTTWERRTTIWYNVNKRGLFDVIVDDPARKRYPAPGKINFSWPRINQNSYPTDEVIAEKETPMLLPPTHTRMGTKPKWMRHRKGAKRDKTVTSCRTRGATRPLGWWPELWKYLYLPLPPSYLPPFSIAESRARNASLRHSTSLLYHSIIKCKLTWASFVCLYFFLKASSLLFVQTIQSSYTPFFTRSIIQFTTLTIIVNAYVLLILLSLETCKLSTSTIEKMNFLLVSAITCVFWFFSLILTVICNNPEKPFCICFNFNFKNSVNTYNFLPILAKIWKNTVTVKSIDDLEKFEKKL